MVKSSLLLLAMISSGVCQELYSSYNTSSIELSGAGFCPSTEKLREEIKQGVDFFLSIRILASIARDTQ